MPASSGETGSADRAGGKHPGRAETAAAAREAAGQDPAAQAKRQAREARGPAIPQAVDEQLKFVRKELRKLRKSSAVLHAKLAMHEHGDGERPARYGVHITPDGTYLMRREDGFHPMLIAAEPLPVDPDMVYRLTEDKRR